MRAVDGFTVAKAAGAGLALAAVNPKNALLAIAAAAEIVEGGLATGEQVAVLLVFVFVASAGVIAPVALTPVLGERARAPLERLRAAGWPATTRRSWPCSSCSSARSSSATRSRGSRRDDVRTRTRRCRRAGLHHPEIGDPIVGNGSEEGVEVVELPPRESRRAPRQLGADDPVVLGDHPRELGRREPARPDPLEILVGRPTGDGAALSDEDGHLVFDELREKLSQGRDADALEVLRRLPRRQLGRVAGEHHCALLSLSLIHI